MSLSVILSKPNPNMIPKAPGKGLKSGQKQPDNEGTNNPTSIFDEITELSSALCLVSQNDIWRGNKLQKQMCLKHDRDKSLSREQNFACRTILSGLVGRHDICENLQKLQKLEIV